MCHQRKAVEMEKSANILEILYLALGGQIRRIRRQLRSTASALIVEDDDVVSGKRCEVGRYALEIDAWTTVKRDDRVAAIADGAVKQARRIGGLEVPLSDRAADHREEEREIDEHE